MYKKYAELRDRQNLNDSQVATQTGIAPQTLSAWKNGLYEPKLDKLKTLAAFFGVPLEELIGD
jgi:repressor LexA